MNQFIIIATFSNRLGNYLVVLKFGRMISTGSIPIIFTTVIAIMITITIIMMIIIMLIIINGINL